MSLREEYNHLIIKYTQTSKMSFDEYLFTLRELINRWRDCSDDNYEKIANLYHFLRNEDMKHCLYAREKVLSIESTLCPDISFEILVESLLRDYILFHQTQLFPNDALESKYADKIDFSYVSKIIDQFDEFPSRYALHKRQSPIQIDGFGISSCIRFIYLFDLLDNFNQSIRLDGEADDEEVIKRLIFSNVRIVTFSVSNKSLVHDKLLFYVRRLNELSGKLSRVRSEDDELDLVLSAIEFLNEFDFLNDNVLKNFAILLDGKIRNLCFTCNSRNMEMFTYIIECLNDWLSHVQQDPVQAYSFILEDKCQRFTVELDQNDSESIFDTVAKKQVLVESQIEKIIVQQIKADHIEFDFRI